MPMVTVGYARVSSLDQDLRWAGLNRAAFTLSLDDDPVGFGGEVALRGFLAV